MHIVLLAGALAFYQCAAMAAADVADAVMRQDATRWTHLLKAAANVNAAQPDGSTALHCGPPTMVTRVPPRYSWVPVPIPAPAATRE